MNASTRRTKLARLVNDPNALPLVFNIDKVGHEYAADLFYALDTHNLRTTS